MKGPTDEQLLGQAILGNRNAYLQIVDRYLPVVYAVIRHRTRDPRDAEEIAVASFRDAFLRLRRLAAPEKFYEEVIGIARQKARMRPIQPSPDLPEAMGSRKELGAEPPDALPHIIRGKYFEGLSYAEIESRLGLAPDSVDFLLRKGRIWSRLQHAGAF